MNHSILLHFLAQPSRRRRQSGITMLTGLLVILALAAGSLALVTLATGDRKGAMMQSESREAQAVAEAGADLVIATLNRPENTKLLVAGGIVLDPNDPSSAVQGVPMKQWTNHGKDSYLRSPCTRSGDLKDPNYGTGPGLSKDGLPSAAARDLGNGQYRNLDNPSGSATSTTEHRFLLKSVRYSAGPSGNSNRRSNSVATTISNDSLSTSGGTYRSDQINLTANDPNNQATRGSNTGHITLEVEGIARLAGGKEVKATIEREYEVVPKCCGGSIGSGGASRLGADGRGCTLDPGAPGTPPSTTENDWSVVALPTGTPTQKCVNLNTNQQVTCQNYADSLNQPSLPYLMVRPALVPQPWDNDANGWPETNKKTIAGRAYYWLSPNRSAGLGPLYGISSPAISYVHPSCPGSVPNTNVNKDCYSYIISTAINYANKGRYRFSFAAGADNNAKFFVGGSPTTGLKPTISGGTLVAERPQNPNNGTQNNFDVKDICPPNTTVWPSGNCASGAEPIAVDLDPFDTTRPNDNKIYVVVSDGWEFTGVLITRLGFTEVPNGENGIDNSSGTGWTGMDWAVRGVSSTRVY